MKTKSNYQAVQRVLRIALSRYIGESRARDGTQIFLLARVLRYYAHATVPERDLPALFPELPLDPRAVTGVADSAGEVARSRLKKRSGNPSEWGWKGFRRQWQALNQASRHLAVWEDEVIEEFLAPELWPVVVAMMADGPAVAAERIERALEAMSGREVAPSVRRPTGGRPAKRTMQAWANAANRLMGILVRLRGRLHDEDLVEVLDAWVTKPRFEIPNGDPGAAIDTTAPSRQLLRLGWQKVRDAVTERFGTDDAEAQKRILDGLSRKRILMGYFRPTRAQAMYAVLASIGCRVGAFTQLRVSDYDRRHRDPTGDVGPALRIYPEKGWEEEVPSWKPIPVGVAEAIDVFLRYMQRRMVLEGLLRYGEELPRDWPLFCAEASKPERALGEQAIRRWLGGQRPQKASSGAHALLPRDSSIPFYGYSPHNVRGGVAQMVTSLEGEQWRQQQEIDHHPISIAEALLDHKNMKLDELGYIGASKPEDREKLAKRGAQVAWTLLTTDAGAEKVLDGEAYRATLLKRTALEDEQQRTRERRKSVFAEARESKTVEAMFETILNLEELEDTLDGQRDELVEAERELRAIESDPDRLVSLPDDADPKRHAVDLGAIKRDVFEGIPEHESRRLRRAREWVTGSEVSWIFGAGRSTVGRWFRGNMPTDPAKWLWDPARVDASLGSKRRRIPADALNKRALDSDLRRRRLAEVLARPVPEGWTEEQAMAPLQSGA